MGELKAGESDCRCPIGFESQHRPAPALDRPMILFDEVVEVRARTHEDVFPTMILATQPAQAQVTGLMAIQADLARPSRRAGRDRLAEECHCGSNSAPGMEQRVDRLSLLVDGTIEYPVFGRVRMWVSSTRQDAPTGFARRFHRCSYSGTYR